MPLNQNSAQLTRDQLDALLIALGGVVQSENSINLTVRQVTSVRTMLDDASVAEGSTPLEEQKRILEEIESGYS